MNNQYLPTPKEIKEKFPLSKDNIFFIKESRNIAKDISSKKSKKKVIFAGPCSIHNYDQIIDYAKKLKQINCKNIFLVMRCYYEKPRTKTGWKGFLYDPNLDNSNDIEKGIMLTRELLIELTNLKIPIATELLDPNLSNYFDDLITWGFIGARTVSSQIHRQLISCYDFPIGLKNNIDGNVDTAICAAIAGGRSHTFSRIDNSGKLAIFTSKGNPFLQIVLRGSKTKTNYNLTDILSTFSKIKKQNQTLPVIVDCSHGNAPKNHNDQIQNFEYILSQMKRGYDNIIGMMLESNIFEGTQVNSANLKSGISITDPCICFEKTKILLEKANQLN
jgi:3-deoxy-7-phosphoheptulonate synthase